MYRRVLTILNPTVPDSAVYQCEASFNRPGSNQVLTAVTEANLTVFGQWDIYLNHISSYLKETCLQVVIQEFNFHYYIN